MSSRGWLLVLVSAALTVAANLMIRTGVIRAGGLEASFDQLPKALTSLARQPLFDFGVLLYGLASVIWFRVIATEPLSTAYPLLVSLTFLLVTIGAVALFQESITLRQLAGLAVILVGIFIVSGK